MIAMARGFAPMAEPKRRERPKTLIQLLQIDNEQLTEESRMGGKVMISDVHRHCLDRVDNAHVLATLAAAQARLPRMVWLVYLAMEFGLVTKNKDGSGILVFAQPPRFLTDEEVAKYYGKAPRTMRDYYEDARRVVRDETTSGAVGLRNG
jgi:hypothetical protein